MSNTVLNLESDDETSMRRRKRANPVSRDSEFDSSSNFSPSSVSTSGSEDEDLAAGDDKAAQKSKKSRKLKLPKAANPAREGSKGGKVNVKTSAVVYESTRYVTTLDNLKSTLDKYGVAVIENVLREEEIQRMNDGMFDAVEEMTKDFSGTRDTKAAEKITPVSRSDQSTWGNMRELMPSHRALIQHWGIGHAKYVWDVRGNARVCDVFSRIHGVRAEDLITSFDGAAVFLPTGKPSSPELLWLHTDQRFCTPPKEKLRYSVQSWVTGYDVAEGSATLAFLEGSHRLHAAFAKRFNLSAHSADWYKLDQQAEFDFLNKEHGCALKAIACKAGSMVLFDSRTFHSGMGPAPGFKLQGVPRSVVYVCMAPRRWCSPADLARRRRIFAQRRLTSHWPHRPKMFALRPRTYGRKLQRIRAPASYAAEEMTSRMRALVPLP